MKLLPQFAQSHKSLDGLLNHIHHANCFDLLAALPDKSVEAIITDPPYGVHEAKWDIVDIKYMKEFKRIVKPRGAVIISCVMSLGWKLIAFDPSWFKYDMVTHKNVPTDFFNAKNKPLRQHENILVFSHGTTANKSPNQMTYNPQMVVSSYYKKLNRAGSYDNSVWGGKGRKHNETDYFKESTVRYPTTIIQQKTLSGGQGIHPNQKDIDLWAWLIKSYSNEGDIVLDPFSGSGTTAIAARKCNRQFICGDMTLEYVEASRKRLQDTDPYQATELSNGQKQLSLFEGEIA